MSEWKPSCAGIRRARKPYMVVRPEEDLDMTYDAFDTYEEALAFAEKSDEKSCIVGPDFVEDLT